MWKPNMACPGLHHPGQQRQPGQKQQRDQPRLDRQQRGDDAADGGDRADGSDQAVDHLDRPVLSGRGSDEAVVEGRRLVGGQLDPGADIDDRLFDVPRGGLGQDLPHFPPAGRHEAQYSDDPHHDGQLRCHRPDARCSVARAGGQYGAD
jgi:hypothetical protein